MNKKKLVKKFGFNVEIGWTIFPKISIIYYRFA